jgi:hypothetical protein
MGWDFERRERGQTTERLLARDLGDRTIVAFGMVGSVAYIAMQETDGRTWAAVVLTKTESGYFNWGYKLMDESMGPCYYDCPRRVLAALTPTEYPEALAWRAKCRERLSRPKITPGVRVSFATPVTFQGGPKSGPWQATGFECLAPNRYRVTEGDYPGTHVRLPKSYLSDRDYQII